jgi:hypothetical protein
MSEGSSRSGGRGSNRGRGQSGSKCPMYEDLDAPQSTDWLTLSDNGTGSGSELREVHHRARNNPNVSMQMRRTQVIH